MDEGCYWVSAPSSSGVSFSIMENWYMLILGPIVASFNWKWPHSVSQCRAGPPNSVSSFCHYIGHFGRIFCCWHFLFGKFTAFGTFQLFRNTVHQYSLRMGVAEQEERVRGQRTYDTKTDSAQHCSLGRGHLTLFPTWNMISGARKVSLPITIMFPSGSLTLSCGWQDSWHRAMSRSVTSW